MTDATQTVTRPLQCKLSDAELRERGDQIAAAELRADVLRAERKRLNASIREQTDLRAQLAKVIDDRAETREVTCEWRPDYRKKQWGLYRSDNGELLPESREMTAEDLQERLPFEGKPKRKGKRPIKATKRAA